MDLDEVYCPSPFGEFDSLVLFPSGLEMEIASAPPLFSSLSGKVGDKEAFLFSPPPLHSSSHVESHGIYIFSSSSFSPPSVLNAVRKESQLAAFLSLFPLSSQTKGAR